MRLFLIDDSGWGCILGGVTVAVFQRKGAKTFSYHSEAIPVEFFQEPKFSKKFYFTQAAKIIQRGFEKFLGKDWIEKLRKEHVILCRSPLFKEIEMFFLKNRISYKKESVQGIPQELIEAENGKHLYNLGIPVKRKSSGHGGLFFMDCVRLINKNPEMKKKAKSGWGKFSKWCS